MINNNFNEYSSSMIYKMKVVRQEEEYSKYKKTLDHLSSYSKKLDDFLDLSDKLERIILKKEF